MAFFKPGMGYRPGPEARHVRLTLGKMDRADYRGSIVYQKKLACNVTYACEKRAIKGKVENRLRDEI